jgi:Zn-dependent protease with chaperone function
MKKTFVSFALLIPILALFFAASNSVGMDQIIQEYPELTDFFNSPEFKEQISGCEVVARYKNPEKSRHIASFNIEINAIDKLEVQKKIVLNTYYINKNLLNAEEFKFIFCHELGHIHDKNLIKGLVTLSLASLGFTGVIGGAAYFTIRSLLDKEWAVSFKRISIGCGLYLVGYLLFMKFFRDGELFADEYSLTITKNKDAAISALQKRKIFNESVTCKFNFIQYLRSLFESHPCESDRIANIEQKSKILKLVD